jgi:hypothetical protein
MISSRHVVAAELIGAAASGSGMARAEVFEYECKLGEWSTTNGKPSGDKQELLFICDTITKESLVVGNAGVAKVTPYFGQEAVTFIEFIPSGITQTIAISLKDGAAVYSRHTLFAGNEFLPSQAFGSCKTKQRHLGGR